MTNFKLIDCETSYLLPPSVDEWLPEDHLARFVMEITDELDISALESAYTGSGSDAYHTWMLLALVFYSYALGQSPGQLYRPRIPDYADQRQWMATGLGRAAH